MDAPCSRPTASLASWWPGKECRCQAAKSTSGRRHDRPDLRAEAGPVKFTWFNLMPWPFLPDDFRQTNHSVWVDIDSRLFDPAKANAMYHEYMDQLEYAEVLGFDGI